MRSGIFYLTEPMVKAVNFNNQLHKKAAGTDPAAVNMITGGLLTLTAIIIIGFGPHVLHSFIGFLHCL